MQNKGFVKVFAVLLTLVCCYYLSFSFVTRYYEKEAIEYANGDYELEYQYLDSLATTNVWLGYTLKDCREREIGLGLDLKGGMTVLLEVDAAAVIRTLANTDDPQFDQALKQAIDENTKGTNKDFVSLFVEKYEAINKSAKLADIFSNGSLKDQIKSTDDNSKVRDVLNKEIESAADNSFQVLGTRIDRFGVVAPNIQKLPGRADRIQIELPGIKEPERVKKLLQGNANLEFWRTYTTQEIGSFLSEVNTKSIEYLAIAKKGEKTAPVAATPDSAAVATTDSAAVPAPAVAEVPAVAADSSNNIGYSKGLVEYFASQGYGAVVALVDKKDTAEVNTILAKFKDSYPIDLKFAWGFKAVDREGVKKETFYELYSLRGDGTKKGPALDGDAVVSAKADQVPNKGWGVSMQMNSAGAKKWASITGAEIGHSIAIVLDGYVYSAPNVDNKIEGGNSSITGHFTVEEAKDLENVLKSGKMKAGVRIVQEDIVGPSLGEEAIQAGLISFVIALIVLMLYMCLVYGFIPGMIANCALLLNLFFTLGILASLRAVMTLPGMAGLVLALAMAVDANVLIYERTKEELRAGKNVKTAVADGYKHAFSAIFDSNLTSIITGLILYNFGSGAIRGFAITEIIGISASFFTAIFMTRIVYEYAFSKGKFQNLTFASKPLQNFLMDTKINFLNLHRKAYAASLAIIILGVISVFTLGLNGGIDFTGGRNYIVRFDKPVSTEDITDALKPQFGEANVSVITIGSSNQVRISTNFRIDDTNDESVESEIRSKMNIALASLIGQGKTIDDYIQSSQKVGPSVADDMKTAAYGAVGLAILCMGLYILFRFRDVAFSVGTIIAVAHDAAIVIFAYSFFHKLMPFSLEIDQTFIAAILTVIGFSIHDKVVIFDRVRERRRDFPTRDIAANINDSLNTTLTRTISTSLSTVLVLICIFIFGGDSIRSFAFAMLLGIILGTYSSVFIATPIAFEFLKKKQDKKQAELKK
ncbi:SecD/SecF fusion protein [Dysgonomonas sp. PH5-45]|uniref:protein translocase subunit SecDF n=1 Tax=unclassified Dysgonomonas TaxID=2630389 RepID=UPI0024758882|nr:MULTISPECIES: protein translocase subunit SecDF [unclassified Dysgonomonas]MDH6354221.1 SecD/SecF fusion protein [Dysgonomonas sp. PH5-45]MDH6387122.1 SecD/SecF fusion protein [Dysgonomonas sp. PH5-37]